MHSATRNRSHLPNLVPQVRISQKKKNPTLLVSQIQIRRRNSKMQMKDLELKQAKDQASETLNSLEQVPPQWVELEEAQ